MIILRLERFLGQRIARISVEPGRYANEFRFEFLKVIEGVAQDFAVLETRRSRRHGIVEAIFSHISSSSAGIERILMDRKGGGSGTVAQYDFGAITVVHIKIVNGNPLHPCSSRFQSGDWNRGEA